MIKQIDGFYVAAQIRFVRQVHKGTILILEGETDARILERFTDLSACQIEIGFGKANVLEALDSLEDDGFAGVVALVDADFDRIIGTQHELENLCLTDAHDLDLTIFATSALDRYLAEFADKDALQREFKSDLKALRQRVLTASLPIAYCRLMSEQQNLDLYFKDLRHDEFISVDDLTVEIDAVTTKIIARSRTSCTVSRLKTYVTGSAVKSYDLYQLANGHDVAAILGIALRKLVGSRRMPQTWASEIESGLRLAFDWEAITNTLMYRCLRGWEANNKPYRIFRQQPV